MRYPGRRARGGRFMTNRRDDFETRSDEDRGRGGRHYDTSRGAPMNMNRRGENFNYTGPQKKEFDQMSNHSDEY